MKSVYFTLGFSLLLQLAAAQASFIDVSAAAGINNAGRNYGLAFGDFDQDGLEDIYISRHNLPNLLYRNLGNGQFANVAAQAGVAHQGTTTMSIWGDIDDAPIPTSLVKQLLSASLGGPQVLE
jgi:hypothetical protein